MKWKKDYLERKKEKRKERKEERKKKRNEMKRKDKERKGNFRKVANEKLPFKKDGGQCVIKRSPPHK